MSFRVGATVLIDYKRNAIQSYGFETKRVLGNLEKVLNSLDAYEVDEIHAIIPHKGKADHDSSSVFSFLSDISISTPLGIGGGISDDNILRITQDPFFERCIFNSAVFNNTQLLKQTKSIMGHQSMVAFMPFIIKRGLLMVYNSDDNKFVKTSNELFKRIDDHFNEIILLDAKAEGSKNGFDFEVLMQIDFPMSRILISGGLTKKDVRKAKKMGLAGVSLDNSALYSEYSVKDLR